MNGSSGQLQLGGQLQWSQLGFTTELVNYATFFQRTLKFVFF